MEHPTLNMDLDSRSLAELRAIWQAHFGRPPKLRSAELLRLMLAWRLQAVAQGGLNRETWRKLARRGPVQPEGRELGVGAILRRDWQGQSIEVVVEETGFLWRGQIWPSLSAIAREATGSRWNGPRFFGLRSSPK